METIPAPDRAAWQSTVQTLLSPCDYADEGAWARSSCQRLADFFDAFAGQMAIGESDGIRPYQAGHAEGAFEETLLSLAGVGPAGIDYADPALQKGLWRVQAAGIQVWDIPLAADVSDVDFARQSWYYNDVIRPHGLEHFILGAVSLPTGQALCGVTFADPRYGRYGRESLELLRMLLPSVRAGILTLALLERSRRQLMDQLERRRDPVVVYHPDGRELFRNRAYDDLLSVDGRPQQLRTAVETLVRDTSALLRNGLPKSWPDELPSGELTVSGGAATRTLRASILSSGTVWPHPAILISVENGALVLPGPEWLRERYGLTPREAEVARLLALGLRNADIAERLGISPHTARHHAQHVLDKTGLPSRKALGVAFITEYRRSPNPDG